MTKTQAQLKEDAKALYEIIAKLEEQVDLYQRSAKLAEDECSRISKLGLVDNDKG